MDVRKRLLRVANALDHFASQKMVKNPNPKGRKKMVTEQYAQQWIAENKGPSKKAPQKKDAPSAPKKPKVPERKVLRDRANEVRKELIKVFDSGKTPDGKKLHEDDLDVAFYYMDIMSDIHAGSISHDDMSDEEVYDRIKGMKETFDLKIDL